MQEEPNATLDDLELRLAKPPLECLGLARSVTISIPQICQAFADLADRAHPRLYMTASPATQARAARVFRMLRDVYWNVVLEHSNKWQQFEVTPAAAMTMDTLATRKMRRR